MGFLSKFFISSKKPKMAPAYGREKIGVESRPKRNALADPMGLPFDGASFFTQETRDWYPLNWSGDSQIGYQRDTLVARSRDLVRNSGWPAGAVTRATDSTIGINFRPLSRPDFRLLRDIAGNKNFDHVWAAEFSQAVDSNWRLWANSAGFYNDAERMLTFGEQMRLAFRNFLIDGDCLAILPWIEDRIGFGRAKWATTVQLVDSVRLSNPAEIFDDFNMRQGVEIDPLTGEPIAYHIQQAQYTDYWSFGDQFEWRRYAKEDEYGRANVVHMFDPDLAGQHRGGAGIFAPVINSLKKLFRYNDATLKAAIINATFANFLKTPFDPQMTAEAIGTENPVNSIFGAMWDKRVDWNQGRQLSIQQTPIPMLAPGEEIQTVSQANPHAQYDPFVKSVLREVAQACGLSSMQLTGDWSDVNYSSARAAILEARTTMDRRLHQFEKRFAQPIRLAWMEEAFWAGDFPLPPGNIVPFEMAREAYGRSKWLGPARGWVDPVKEMQGIDLRLQAGLTTLSSECAENSGADWEEIRDQRLVEIKSFKEMGMPLPDWMLAEPTLPQGPEVEDNEEKNEKNAFFKQGKF